MYSVPIPLASSSFQSSCFSTSYARSQWPTQPCPYCFENHVSTSKTASPSLQLDFSSTNCFWAFFCSLSYIGFQSEPILVYYYSSCLYSFSIQNFDFGQNLAKWGFCHFGIGTQLPDFYSLDLIRFLPRHQKSWVWDICCRFQRNLLWCS